MTKDSRDILFGALVIVLLIIAIFLSGCSSIGPTLSTSSGLGYARPSVGAIAQLEGKAGRVEARVLSVEKQDGGEGYAITGSALLDVVPHRDWKLLVGADGNYQHAKLYDSQRIAPRVEAGWRGLSAYWIGADRKVERVVGARVQIRGLIIDGSRVEHTQGTGSRIEFAYLWRLP